MGCLYDHSNILHWSFLRSPPPCGAAEATGLGFVCFVVINRRVLSANRVDLGFMFHNFSILPPPPDLSAETEWTVLDQGALEDTAGIVLRWLNNNALLRWGDYWWRYRGGSFAHLWLDFYSSYLCWGGTQKAVCKANNCYYIIIQYL